MILTTQCQAFGFVIENAVTKYPAAQHGLKQTKCLAVKTFPAIYAKRLFQTSQGYQIFVKECQAIPKMYLVFFSGQILRACAYYKIARLSTTWKFNASDQTVGHGLKLTKLGLELFIKMPLKGSFKVLESMRCLLRNVKQC